MSTAFFCEYIYILPPQFLTVYFSSAALKKNPQDRVAIHGFIFELGVVMNTLHCICMLHPLQYELYKEPRKLIPNVHGTITICP
jgi:hypothetical protein